MPPGADTAELRWAMPDEPLSQVELRAVAHLTRVPGSTDDVTAVAQGLAEAIQAGRVNRDVYSYVYDTEAKELVLTGATESPAAEQVRRETVPQLVRFHAARDAGRRRVFLDQIPKRFARQRPAATMPRRCSVFSRALRRIRLRSAPARKRSARCRASRPIASRCPPCR